MNQGSLPVVVLFLLVGIGAAGCQTRTDDPDLTPGDATALRAALAAYVNAANTGAAAHWAALYAEDAVMMPPNTPAIEGRAAIESWLAMLPVISGAEGTVLEVEGVGDLAYVRGTYAMSVTIPGLPAPVSQKGKLLQIYMRQASGSWLLARDIWNADAPSGSP